MQLKTRLTLQFLIAVAPILLISFAVIYWSSAKYRHNEFYERLQKRALTTVEFLTKVDQVDSTLLKVIDRTQKDNLPKENVTVYNYLNQKLYTNNDSVFFDVDKQLIDDIRLNSPMRFTQKGYEIIGLTYNDKYNRFVIIAGAKDLYGLSKLSNLRNTLFLLFFIIVGITALIGWLYSSRALKPISNVVSKAEKISANNLSERLTPPKYNDEIGKLVSAFNTMLGRIEDAFKIQKLFVAGASHELKNPLTVITTQLEVSAMKNRTTEEYKETIKSVLEDIKELNSLTTQLIDFGRLSQESIDIDYKPLRIDELLSDFTESFAKRNKQSAINYKIEILPDDENRLVLAINKALLTTAFTNLADNACKFSPEKKVDVVLQANDKTINIYFCDNGPGIAAEDRPFIFEPFYRSKNPTSVKGHGIGLPLTWKILALHNAGITIVESPLYATVFKISMAQQSLIET